MSTRGGLKRGARASAASKFATATATATLAMAVAGCLSKTPAPAHGYLPDAGGIFGEGACPDAGATSVDGEDRSGASADASDGDAAALGANAGDVAAPDGGDDATDGGAGATDSPDETDAPDARASLGADAFAGTWTFVSGGSGVSCPDGISAAAATGALTIRMSSDGGLTVSEDACTFHFTIAGDTATSDCGQSCSAWEIPTIPVWTLTLNADGTLVEHLGGRIGLHDETCTISGTSKLTRPAP